MSTIAVSRSMPTKGKGKGTGKGKALPTRGKGVDLSKRPDWRASRDAEQQAHEQAMKLWPRVVLMCGSDEAPYEKHGCAAGAVALLRRQLSDASFMVDEWKLDQWDPLHITQLLDQCSVILIPGGHPEYQACGLGPEASEGKQLLEQALTCGVPALGICVGAWLLSAQYFDFIPVDILQANGVEEVNN